MSAVWNSGRLWINEGGIRQLTLRHLMSNKSFPLRTPAAPIPMPLNPFSLGLMTTALAFRGLPRGFLAVFGDEGEGARSTADVVRSVLNRPVEERKSGIAGVDMPAPGYGGKSENQ
jgi:hypothetical protein